MIKPKTSSHAVVFLILIFLFSACGTRTYEPAEVVFSVESGAYPDSVILELSAPRGYTIRYTTDSSLPDTDSPRYKKAIVLSGSGTSWLNEEKIDLIHVEKMFRLTESEELSDAWIIRAAAFAPDGTMGPVSTRTYFPERSLVSEYGGVAVISLVTDPENLFDYENGILAKGKIFDEWYQNDNGKEILKDKSHWWKIEANFTQKGRDWERPASIEIFDGNDLLSIRQEAGLRLQGSASRMFSHKSFRVYFRKEYGTKALVYDLFPEDGATSYKTITLRNGGNLANSLIFKDSWQQSLLADRAFLVQNTRPAVAYLNGEYWGVYCMNDRYDKQSLKERFGLKNVLIVKEGEYEDGDEGKMYLYDDLCGFGEKDMSDPLVWEQFKEIMDIRSMADYFAAEIYIGNHDFSQTKNTQLWRSLTIDPENPYGDGKWRFMLQDTDFSSGLYGDERTSADRNTLAEAIDKYPLFASALKSEEFREIFISSLREIGSVNFAPERVDRTLDEWSEKWIGLMGSQYQRFGDYSAQWNKQIDGIREFYKDRYPYIIGFAEEMLGERE